MDVEIKKEPFEYNDVLPTGDNESLRFAELKVKELNFYEDFSSIRVIDEQDDLITVDASSLKSDDECLFLENIKKNKIAINFGKQQQRYTRECSRKFNVKRSYLQYKRHGMGDVLERKFRCNVCPLTFATDEELQNHASLHRSNKLFCEHFCGCYYETIQECELHEILEHPGCLLQCKVCDRRFLVASDLAKHMIQLHGLLQRFACSFCRQWFPYPGQLAAHWESDLHPCGRLLENDDMNAKTSSSSRLGYQSDDCSNESLTIEHINDLQKKQIIIPDDTKSIEEIAVQIEASATPVFNNQLTKINIKSKPIEKVIPFKCEINSEFHSGGERTKTKKPIGCLDVRNVGNKLDLKNVTPFPSKKKLTTTAAFVQGGKAFQNPFKPRAIRIMTLPPNSKTNRIARSSVDQETSTIQNGNFIKENDMMNGEDNIKREKLNDGINNLNKINFELGISENSNPDCKEESSKKIIILNGAKRNLPAAFHTKENSDIHKRKRNDDSLECGSARTRLRTDLDVPKPLFVSLAGGVNKTLSNARKQYSNYWFDLMCPHCTRRYELRYAFRTHLNAVHGISMEEINNIIMEVKPFRFEAKYKIPEKCLEKLRFTQFHKL